MKFYLDNWRWQGVPLRSHGQKNAGKQSSIVIQFQPVPHSTFLLKGRHDAKPLNHKHSASNGYQATVYDKTRFVTFVETSGNGFDYFSCLPNHLKLTKHWY
jgi:glucose-6-phosphate 1-dehydrogenase